MKKTEEKTFTLYEYELWSNIENKFTNRTLLLTKNEATALNKEWPNHDMKWLRTHSEHGHDVEKSVSMVLTVTKQTWWDRIVLYLTVSLGFSFFTMALSLLMDIFQHGIQDWFGIGIYLFIAAICGVAVGIGCFGIFLVIDFVCHIVLNFKTEDDV